MQMNTANTGASAEAAPEWMTRAEFARMARISLTTAKRWASTGIGPTAHRVGPRMVRYRRAEVEDWMAGTPR